MKSNGGRPGCTAGFLSFCMPHGLLSLIPMLVAPVALALTIIAALNCSFIEVLTIVNRYSGAAFDDEGNVTHVDLDTSYERDFYALQYWACDSENDPTSFEFILQQYYGSGLTDDEIEANPFNVFADPDYSVQTEQKFRAALACGFVAILIGGMTMMFLHLATCISYPTIALKLMGFGFLLTSLFSALMLTVFSAEMCDSTEASNCVSNFRNQTRVDEVEKQEQIPLDGVCHEGCRLGPGGGMAVAATILWFIASIFTCFLWGEGSYNGDDDNEDDDGTKQVEREPLIEQQQRQVVGPESHTQQQEQVIFQYDNERGNGTHEVVVPPPTSTRRTSDQGLPSVAPPQGGIVEELTF